MVHRRKAIFTKIGILIPCHILDICLAITLCFEYRVHSLFQSEHTVLQCLLHLVHSTTYTLLIYVTCHRLVVLHTVTVAEHNALICNIFVRNFGIYKIFDYLCRSIKDLLVYFLLNRL